MVKWDYLDMEEAIRGIDTITYNWNFITICFEIWESEIIKARQKIDIENTNSVEQKIGLKEITGTGENYIRELCAGRKKEVKRTFNSSDDRLISYLRGREGFDVIMQLKRFIVLNNAYNMLISLKKRKESYSDIEEWIDENRNPRYADIKIELYNLKNKAKEMISKMKLKYDDTKTLTDLGRLRAYLLGEKNVEVSYSELQGKLVQLSVAVYGLPCEVIEKFSEQEFDTVYMFAEMLFHRVNSIKQYRIAKDKERQLREDVYSQQYSKEVQERKDEEQAKQDYEDSIRGIRKKILKNF